MSPEYWRWIRIGAGLVLFVGLGLGGLRLARATYPWLESSARGRALTRLLLTLWSGSLGTAMVAGLFGWRQLTVVAGGLSGLLLVAMVITLPFLVVAYLAHRWARSTPVPLEPAALEPARDPVVEAAPAEGEASAPEPSPLLVTALSRRELVARAAAVTPLGGVLVAGMGATSGVSDAVLTEVELTYPDLPPALEGLKILQYSDVHLGAFIGLAEIEALVELGKKARADLVLLTGDIADDLDRLPAALDTFSDLAPRLGVFAAIGNHEYFRGLRETRRAYERSSVPLLLETGTTLKVGDASLFLGGADDPRVLSRQRPGFFDRTVKTVLDGAPSDAFRVLMSHRPEGFDAAAKEGVHLTLAGHTHGAQLGFNERSLFERLLPESYLWGHYARDGAQLYTCSGAGHWFPFRIGCPREVPVLVLRRGPAGTAARKRRIA